MHRRRSRSGWSSFGRTAFAFCSEWSIPPRRCAFAAIHTNPLHLPSVWNTDHSQFSFTHLCRGRFGNTGSQPNHTQECIIIVCTLRSVNTHFRKQFTVISKTILGEHFIGSHVPVADPGHFRGSIETPFCLLHYLCASVLNAPHPCTRTKELVYVATSI